MTGPTTDSKSATSWAALAIVLGAAVTLAIGGTSWASMPGETELGVQQEPGPVAQDVRPLQAPGLVAPGAQLEQISTGHKFTEGPAVAADGTLYFSDVQSSTIHKMATSGQVGLHRQNTERSNGLYFDAGGALIVCVMGGHRVVRDNLAGGISVVADSFGGRPLVAPNDVWVHPNGGIYFTDPDFSGTAQSSVFFVPTAGHPPVQVLSNLNQPNGVIGTPDGNTLYVSDYAGHTWRYRINSNGSLSDATLFADTPGDGMTLDERGNVYVATEQVRIFSPEGVELESIEVPETPSNVTFGGADGRTLFITAQTSVYSLRMTVRGAYAVTWEPSSTPTVTAGTPTVTAGTPTQAPTDAATDIPMDTPTAIPTPTITDTPAATLTPTDEGQPITLYLPLVWKGDGF